MSVCVNDTDGDGDCAACARNPEAPCRVSAEEAARERVIYFLEYAFPSKGGDELRKLCETVLDAYAHELAEKIRADIIPEEQQHYREQQAEQDGMRNAADLIDPEVSDSGA